MAREEEDREDLLRDATALVERVELSIPGEAETIVAGFRSDGSTSLYFGSDPAYHFNAADQLRRAFADGLLYRADRGRLAALRRERTSTQVTLVRHDLSPAENQEFLAELNRRRAAFLAALQEGNYQITGQVPADRDVTARVARWLAALPAMAPIANSPRLG